MYADVAAELLYFWKQYLQLTLIWLWKNAGE